MGRQPLSARAPVIPSSSAASSTGPVPGDGHVAELLPFRRPDLSTHESEFQSLIRNVVELARILTGASGSAIAFRGEQGTICRARSGEGAPPLGALVDTTSGISKQCLDSGASLRCDDIATDGRVDPEISQAVGIRALAVVPIHSNGNGNGNTNGDICGILEVFSNAPAVFADQHLKTLRQLADWVGSATDMPGEPPNCDSTVEVQPDIKLLVELEPAHRAFFRSLANTVLLRSPGRLAGPSIQTDGWNDVLVDSHVPWKRFVESVFLHIVVIGVLSALSRFWPQELNLSPPPLREAHVVYYPFSQSFPARESSPPAVHPITPQTLANPKVIKAGRDREPAVASATRSTGDEQKAPALTAPAPAMPILALRRFRKPQLPAALPPPPDIDRAQARRSQMPDLSAVAPPPDLGGGSGSRRITAPRAAVVPPSPDMQASTSAKAAGLSPTAQLGAGTARAPAIAIVPPPPSLNERAALTYGASGAISSNAVEVVAPPPSVQTGTDSKTAARALEGGASQAVPPPPSLEGAGAGNFVQGGGGRATSLAAGGSQVVPPAPSMRNGGNDVGSGRMSSLGQGDSQVVPPPPSVQLGAGGKSGGAGRGRAGSLAGAPSEGVLPPASAPGEGTSNPGGSKDVAISSVPETGGDRKHPVFQDVEVRVISLTWAPQRSSYFSNFEVFIAEKRLNKNESEFIKLVYEFLPYQQRLSEYSLHDLKVQKLRVARDSTCDESLMQMAWPEGEHVPPGSNHARDALASSPGDRNNALPCYRTTADDYRRAVSRSR